MTYILEREIDKGIEFIDKKDIDFCGVDMKEGYKDNYIIINDKTFFIIDKNENNDLILTKNNNVFCLKQNDFDVKKQINKIIDETTKQLTEKSELITQEIMQKFGRLSNIITETINTINLKIREQTQIQMQMQKIKDTLMDKKKIKNEIELIQKHPMCKNITIAQDKLVIHTNKIICTEPHTKRKYMIGEVLIKISLINIDVKFVSTEIFNSAYVHPHVLNQRGEVCFGNAETQIVNYISDKEYYALFVTLINFLQTTNVEDEIGKNICEWDEINDDGKVIQSGHTCESPFDEYGVGDGAFIGYCVICGKEIYSNETHHEFKEDIFCESCFKDEVATCDCCSDEFYRDDLNQIDGKLICDECLKDIEDECEE